jgi:hypothetical protein
VPALLSRLDASGRLHGTPRNAREGVARGALEEAEPVIAIDGILGVFSIARIGQVQVIFRARFADASSPIFAPGQESLEVRLFGSDEIPSNEIAFPPGILGSERMARVG